MRATGRLITAAFIADSVWDALQTGHIVASTMGYYISRIFGDTDGISLNYARRTLFTYSTSLASGAYYVPAAGTVVMTAALPGVAVNDFLLFYDTDEITRTAAAGGSPNIGGWVGATYFDGTNLKYKNADGGALDLILLGVTP